MPIMILGLVLLIGLLFLVIIRFVHDAKNNNYTPPDSIFRKMRRGEEVEDAEEDEQPEKKEVFFPKEDELELEKRKRNIK